MVLGCYPAGDVTLASLQVFTLMPGCEKKWEIALFMDTPVLMHFGYGHSLFVS